MTVTDNAVARYETKDGATIAFAFDECPSNPLEDVDGVVIGIARDERDVTTFDPTGVLEEYDELAMRIEDNKANLDYARKYLGDELIDRALSGELDYYYHESFDYALVASLDELREDEEELKGIVYLEWQDLEEYGWPNYRIAYRPEDMIKQGWNADRLDEIVKGMAREYSAWANGSIYIMGVEHPDGEEEYIPCWAGFDPCDLKDVEGMANTLLPIDEELRRI
ncbi:hypothetical protein LA324_05330 [Corynebacterium coyleae]|uniref:hypothetical protein n=1 Tax=Corynebacterium coyleae TaxID=53374 RepID=UPI001CCE1080|nr:hypothetical protein [Corynebacterium coyleae]UBI10032.1 hypothetical protein LA324_05330 [Corynebacterium coyleae]